MTAKRTKILEALGQFYDTVAKLRDPKHGCPWDLEQNHQSLRHYMLEEAYEAAAVMDKDSNPALSEELGDVLLQVFLNAQIADDDQRFDLSTVARGIDEKMQRRHPHVFSDERLNTSEEVKSRYEAIKAREKGTGPAEYFNSKTLAAFPALLQAFDIGKRAARIKFDWDHAKEVWQKVRSEVEEVDGALKSSDFKSSPEVFSELGDLFFSLAQLCRHLGTDPEAIAMDGNQKFLARFRKVEKMAREQGKSVQTLDRSELEVLWNKAKTE